MKLLFAITLLLRLSQGGVAPVTRYDVFAGTTSGSYALASQVSSWTTNTDGTRTLSVANWDDTTPKYIVVRAVNSFGSSPNSNETYAGKAQAPALSDVTPGP